MTCIVLLSIAIWIPIYIYIVSILSGGESLRIYAMSKYVAFDVETNGLFPDCPGGCLVEGPSILCAVTMVVTRTATGTMLCDPAIHWAANPGQTMATAEVDELLEYLLISNAKGLVPMTWNGLGFDFRVLCANCSEAKREDCKKLSLNHVDPMFTFFCQRGFPVALDSVANAYQTMRKSGSGADAITDWSEGTEDSKKRVLDYCERDVAVLVAAVAACDMMERVAWITKSKGKIAYSDRLDVFRTTAECLCDSEIDNSWMGSDRPTRLSFTRWAI
jgi:hypothetical protein